MFQIDWAQAQLWEKEAQPTGTQSSQVDREKVRRTSLLHWEEHCQECAIPTCYSTCSLYTARADQKCSRFVYGIYPNTSFHGLFDFGADVRFRRWAKLEAQLYGKSISVPQHRFLDRVDRLVTRPLKGRPGASARSIPRSVQGRTLFAKIRNKYLVRVAPAGEPTTFDEFLIECFSPESESFRLIVEYFDGQMKARSSFEIQPGWNLHRMPSQEFHFGRERASGKIMLYPENNAERRVIFTWLDFAAYEGEYRPRSRIERSLKTAATPATFVKCVAWDLDNTLWQGILAEDTASGLKHRPEAAELIRKLDERGIIQTIVSKNNFAEAWAVVEQLGLREYFLHPAINWRPKSSNLKDIAQKLNLNLDSFALLDDSPFERAEVHAAVPQMRVYGEDQIGNLLALREFDVPVTDLSKRRRESYVTEARRDQEKETFRGDYESFLRSCEMKLRLFVPREEGHIQRCLELIQRANQLNLSNTRYSAREFADVLSSRVSLCIAMECEDRFGQYGIVGFARVAEGPGTATLRDFVLSCRVAQKRVEHTFIEWLAKRELIGSRNSLAAEIVPTERNMPIVQVFEEVFLGLGGKAIASKIDKRVLVITALDFRTWKQTIGTIDVEASSELCSQEAVAAPLP